MVDVKINKDLIPRSNARNAYDLLSEVIDLILEEPKRYNQGNWIQAAKGEPNDRLNFPACGTTGCVAGWCIILKDFDTAEGAAQNPWTRNYTVVIGNNARKLLGLTQQQAAELFDGGAAGLTRGYRGVTAEEHADKGAAHIRKFQSKYAEQLKAKAL